jgi:predicted RecB family nuclease
VPASLLDARNRNRQPRASCDQYRDVEDTVLDFHRLAEVKDGGTSIVLLEEWMQTREQRLLDEIAAYNEEDCVATLYSSATRNSSTR